MTRGRTVRLTLVVLFVVGLAVGLAAACGTSDKFAGTWVQADKKDTGLVIEKKDDTHYNVHDPDGSNAFVATVSGNSLVGQIDVGKINGKTSQMADVKMDFNGDKMTFTLTLGGQNQSFQMVRK